MQRGKRACIAASALALTVMATSCGTKDEGSAPAGNSAPPATGPTEATPAPPAVNAPDDNTPAPPATTAPAGGADATGPGAIDHVRDRAERLWKAKLTEDWATVYQLRDPAVRNDGTEEEYIAWSETSEPFRIEGYELGDVLVEDGMAWVQVGASISTRQFESPARRVERWDKWRYIEDDGWYPVPKRLLENYPIAPVLRDREAEEHLYERFMLSWEARKERDWQAYLDMYAPADREIMTLDEFAKVNEMFIYEDVDVLWVEVVGNRGNVRVAISERVTDPSMSKLPAQVAVSTEKWTKVDGEWYAYLGLAGSQTQGQAQIQTQTRGGS